MILTGAALIARFEFLIAAFGVLLIVTAIRMARGGDEEADLSKNFVVRTVQRLMPVTEGYRGQRFTIVEQGKRWVTPLLVVLLVVETSDVIFAVDSIPAVFGITTDPFIVYTSNVFAILGLRSLYFLLAGVVDKFHFLKLGLSIVLGFVGVKMVVETITGYTMDHPIHVPIQWSLLVIAIVLGVSVGASLLFPRRELEPALVEVTEPSPEDLLRDREELRRNAQEVG